MQVYIQVYTHTEEDEEEKRGGLGEQDTSGLEHESCGIIHADQTCQPDDPVRQLLLMRMQNTMHA